MQGEVLVRCFEIFRERHLGRSTARGRAFEAFVRSEYTRWGEVIRRTGIQGER